jgi:nucleoid-associated protein YgaU
MVARTSTSSSQSTSKAVLQKFDPASGRDVDYLTCQFNPEKVKISKQLTWSSSNQPDLNAPDVMFGGGQSATFDLELWFDTAQENNQDVRGYTNKLLMLTLKATANTSPPVVRLVWGMFKTFRAVVTGVDIEYKMFLPTGVPVRARATLHLRQASDGDSGRLPAQNPTSRTNPRKTYRVQEGDRLDFLAFREYGQATEWRRIAEANGLDNPLDLRPGMLLVIPQD